jgi:hypothetical protein
MRVPLEFEWGGGAYRAVTSLVNGGGALVLSPVFCPLRSEVRVRNLENGSEADFRVVWSWFDRAQEGVKCRLALEMTGPGESFWGPGYQIAAARMLSEDAPPEPRAKASAPSPTAV